MKIFDPYEYLGVAKDADADTIRAAFKARAKVVHPDVGGSAHDFTWLRFSRDLLLDPAARARYDETGEVPTEGADNATARLLTQLTTLLGQTFQTVLQRGGEPAQGDFVAAMLAVASGQEKTAQDAIAQGHKSLEKVRQLAGRFRLATLDEPNHLETVVASQICQLEAYLQTLQGQLVELQNTMAYLRTITFNQG